MTGGKLIPKSVLKIGVKLPEMRMGNNSRSTPDLSGIHRGDLEDEDEEEERQTPVGKKEKKKRPGSRLRHLLSENPFIQNDKNRLMGKSLFRPSFTRFGSQAKQQWQQSERPAPNQIILDEVSLSQRERVRNELTQVLKATKRGRRLGDSASHSESSDPASEEEEEETDLQHRLLAPRELMEQRQHQRILLGNFQNSSNLRAWPSSPSVVQMENSEEDQDGNKKVTRNFATEIGSIRRSRAALSQCCRCRQPVYPLEKVEPVAGQNYHPQCFRCIHCHTKLSLATFCRSLESNRDLSVYCRQHQPKGDKVFLCKFSTRKSEFPAFKLSWQQ